jgi:MscS family membrane protein
MFRAVADRPPDPSLHDIEEVVAGPRFWEVPGVWLRLHLPAWARRPVGPLDAYQWVGLVVAVVVSGGLARLMLGRVYALVGWLLRQGGSCLGQRFISRKLRPLTWLAGLWLFFQALGCLDLPAELFDGVLAFKKFLLSGLVAWFGCRFIDLAMAVYTDSELLKPHRSLGDMIVPVTVRVAKAAVVLVVSTYLVYLVGQGDLLGRFLTGLGVAGLAASLAAQDALKSFYGTLLLIGERSFKLGDRIVVNSQAGVVEQVGFRATRLRADDGSLLTIPNATIATAAISNLGSGRPPTSRAA